MLDVMACLYHRTPHQNIASILEKGLLPSPNFVCLSISPSSWYNEHPLLEVDID